MGVLFALFYQPIANLFYFFIGIFSITEIWLAVLVLVFSVKLILLPINIKVLNIQALLKKMQPRLEKVKTNLKADRQKQAEAVMKLYKENGINPLSPLIVFVQIPFFLAIFFFFRDLTNASFVASEVLYDKVLLSSGGIELDSTLFYFDLFEKGGFFLAIIVIVSQYAYFKISSVHIKQSNMQQIFIRVVLVFILIGCFLLPGIISLYWFFTNTISLIFDFLYFKKLKISQQEIQATS